MNTYTVTALQQGAPVATITVPAPDALTAIAATEAKLNLKAVPMAMGQNGHTVTVTWTGLEFQARRVSEVTAL